MFKYDRLFDESELTEEVKIIKKSKNNTLNNLDTIICELNYYDKSKPGYKNELKLKLNIENKIIYIILIMKDKALKRTLYSVNLLYKKNVINNLELKIKEFSDTCDVKRKNFFKVLIKKIENNENIENFKIFFNNLNNPNNIYYLTDKSNETIYIIKNNINFNLKFDGYLFFFYFEYNFTEEDSKKILNNSEEVDNKNKNIEIEENYVENIKNFKEKDYKYYEDLMNNVDYEISYYKKSISKLSVDLNTLELYIKKTNDIEKSNKELNKKKLKIEKEIKSMQPIHILLNTIKKDPILKKEYKIYNKKKKLLFKTKDNNKNLNKKLNKKLKYLDEITNHIKNKYKNLNNNWWNNNKFIDYTCYIENLNCKYCSYNMSNCFVLPCMHLLACYNCISILHKKMNLCLICNKFFTDFKEIKFS